uniref:G-patch domain-containing protein n=1 Tax=Setaria digitata TaxID=48799 RepID=A0A915Q731_9BILA
MSFLTTSRRKRRITITPQNLVWQNDDSRFGKLMMEKTGWKPGCGLGKYEQGITQNLQIKTNNLTEGLGFVRHDGDLLDVHQEVFAAILADLNEKKKRAQTEQFKKNLNMRTKQLKKSVNEIQSKISNEHRKGIYSSNLSVMSEQDKCAIFGRKSAAKTVGKRAEKDVEKDEVS